MHHVSRFPVLVVLFISVSTHARTGAAVHKELLKAVKGAVVAYRAHGMSGLIGTFAHPRGDAAAIAGAHSSHGVSP